MYRERLRQFPSLVNCCTIDWYTAWPADALAAVATKLLAPIADTTADVKLKLAAICQSVHEGARELSARFKQREGRINYVTPTSYLELLTMFTALLAKQRGAVSGAQKRYTVRSQTVGGDSSDLPFLLLFSFEPARFFLAVRTASSTPVDFSSIVVYNKSVAPPAVHTCATRCAEVLP